MTKQHLRSSLFAFLFVIATISTALHELSPHHHSDNCPVCVVDEHSLSSDLVDTVTQQKKILFYEDYSFRTSYKRELLPTSLNARAPPLIFS